MELSSSLIIGTAGQTDCGNYLACTNGGVLQFTTAAPTITINSLNTDLSLGNKVLVENGVLAYRGVSGVILTNNQAATGVGRFDWQGKNTLRLNNSTATNTLAGGYTFADNLGSTNYTRLEMINGATAINGMGVTIDGAHGGSLLLSNAVAGFTGGLTLTNGAVVTCSGATNTILQALIPCSGALNVASNSVLLLTGANTVGSLSGGGLVSNDTLTVTGVLTPGFPGVVGALTVMSNLTIGANATINWKYSATTNDVIHVAGTLTLPAVATVNVTRVSGELPNAGVVFEAGSITGEPGDWVVQGDGVSDIRVIVLGNQVQLVTLNKGTMFTFY